MQDAVTMFELKLACTDDVNDLVCIRVRRCETREQICKQNAWVEGSTWRFEDSSVSLVRRQNWRRYCAWLPQNDSSRAQCDHIHVDEKCISSVRNVRGTRAQTTLNDGRFMHTFADGGRASEVQR